MPVRLVTVEEIDGWKADVAAGLAKAQARQRRALAPALAAHGLTWGSPAAVTTAEIWSEGSWADAVERDLAPVVRRVAAQVAARVRSRVGRRTRAAFGDPVEQLAAMVLDKALAMRPALQVKPAVLTAASPAANPVRFGGVTHPDASPTILDEFQARFAELDRITERVTAHMTDAAQALLAEGASTVDTGVRYVWNAEMDERTRPEHEDAHGQDQAAGDAFDVGGEDLMYPGDPSGSDENIDNCRCWLELIGVDLDRDFEASLAMEAGE